MIRLTQTVAQGGCAAKLPAAELKNVLSGLSLLRPPELAVGPETWDDACLWKLGDGRLLVQTLDFFTPILDDPYDFGAVAAANALSDVYAMGGQPRLALSILAFPSRTLPLEILRPLLSGATDKIHEAGACLAGGHSIDDETLKLGFSVTGFVDSGAAWTNAGARPGDVLLLTKALGTGTITSALKGNEAKPEWVEAATRSMTLLNSAPELLRGLEVHAATDVTGFSLAGHALQLALASGVRLRIRSADLPVIPGALECLRSGWLNRAHHTNRAYAHARMTLPTGIAEELRWLLFDPQTSGGLLLCVPEASAQETLKRLRGRFPDTRIIGEVLPCPVTETGEDPARLLIET
jgi:selenide, water dikinase